MYYLPLYLQFIKIRLQSMIEYRATFLTGAVAQFVSYGSTFLLVWVMVNQFGTLSGWNPYEVMFLYSLNLGSYAITGYFLFNLCFRLPTLIQTGEFDEVLTKPLNPLLYIVCRDFNYGYFSHLILSIVIMTICFIKLGIVVTFLKLILLVVVILAAALIQGAALLFTSVPSFWLVRGNSLMKTFFFDVKDFIQYPISLYNKTIQIMLTFVFPYAFISFYPAQYFLEKNDFLMFHPIFQYLTPIVGVVMFVLAYGFWNLGINNYKSTGS